MLCFRVRIIGVFTFLFSLKVFSQTAVCDSLKLFLSKAGSDTAKARILNALIENEYDDKIWPLYNEQLQDLAESRLQKISPKHPEYNNWLVHLSASYTNSGFIANRRGLVQLALDFYSKALKIQEQNADKAGLASTLNNMAFIYDNQGNVSKALEIFNRCLKIYEEIKSNENIAIVQNNLGLLYYNHGDRTAAGTKADKMRAGVEKALKYYEESLIYYRLNPNLRSEAYIYNNIGKAYTSLGNYELSLDYFNRSLKIHEQTGDKRGMAFSLNNMASLYFDKKDYSKALKLSQRSLEISKSIPNVETIKFAAKLLKDIYYEKKDFRKAYEFQELFMAMRDSLANEQTRKATVKTELKYEYEKKATADSIKNTEEKKVAQAQLVAKNAQIEQVKFQRISLVGGLVFAIVSLLFVVSRFRVAKRQKKIIEMQKLKVDEAYSQLHDKNKEVMDSIHYARRIQRALITNETYISRQLKRLSKRN